MRSLVSKFGHCLNDILFRVATQHLPVEVVAIASNHRDFYQLAASHNIPSTTTRCSAPRLSKGFSQERKLIELIDEQPVDLVVLARYMQILSPELCDASGRAINIHHSFLPSFKGAPPYHWSRRARASRSAPRANYVTSDLDGADH